MASPKQPGDLTLRREIEIGLDMAAAFLELHPECDNIREVLEAAIETDLLDRIDRLEGVEPQTREPR